MKTTERLLEMVDLLGGGRVWSVRDLATRFGVTERTVYRDLERLEAAHVPVVRWDGGFRLTPDARLRPLNLTVDERAMLALAVSSPSLRSNDLHARRADLLAAKLGAVFRVETDRGFVLGGPERSGTIPASVVENVELAIRERKVLETDYVSLSSGERTRTIEPWKLVHRDGVWYLAAHRRESDDLRFFRVDRIKRAVVTDETFDTPDEPRVEQALRRSWSIYQGETLWQIEVRFDSELAPLVEHGQHHDGEQVERLPTGEVSYRVELNHLDEIARWILGFGGRARVIEPEDLRARVEELASGALAVHRKRRGPKRAGERESTRPVRRRQTGQTSRTGRTK